MIDLKIRIFEFNSQNLDRDYSVILIKVISTWKDSKNVIYFYWVAQECHLTL